MKMTVKLLAMMPSLLETTLKCETEKPKAESFGNHDFCAFLDVLSIFSAHGTPDPHGSGKEPLDETD